MTRTLRAAVLVACVVVASVVWVVYRSVGQARGSNQLVVPLNELMKDLLLFARPPQPKPAPIDVAALIATTADLLKIVFVNVLVNGAHAMQGRGTIRVSLATKADTCQIAFADDGPGIPLDVREKIFAPFFTTKARGSGLGLPTAKRRIEAHRGNITIACPTAGGTIVTVELPGTAATAVM